MQLTIIRHGQTQSNVSKMIQGHLHGKLTLEGIKQAKKLGIRLKNEKFDLILCSDLGRAKDTLAIILKVSNHRNVKVKYMKELRERCFGINEGIKIKDAESRLLKSGKSRFEYKPKGGESRIHVQKRMNKFLEKIKKQHFGKKILICSHGTTNNILIGLLLEYTLEESFEKIRQNNTCVNIVELTRAGKGNAIVINCTKHLN